MSVCLSRAALLHYCTDPDVTLWDGTGCPLPFSYALLGGFAIDAQVSLLWQHMRLVQNVSCCALVLAALLVMHVWHWRATIKRVVSIHSKVSG